MSATTTSVKTAPPVTASEASGANLLAACGYDYRLTAVVIALQPDWKELLQTIGPGRPRRNLANFVWRVREGLGKDCDLAREISEGKP